MAEASNVGTAPKAAAKRKTAAKLQTAGYHPQACGQAQTDHQKTTPEFAVKRRKPVAMAFLASLGFYGKTFDQAQEQYNSLQDQLKTDARRPTSSTKELVKRGQKVEKDAKVALKDIELPKLELENPDRPQKLEKQLKKVKARFEELKETVGLKSAA